MDIRTLKKFKKSFVDNGGHSGYQTINAAESIFIRYLKPLGVTSTAAGKILAAKFNNNDNYIDNMIIGPSASISHRAVYALDGVVKRETVPTKVKFL